ncbi:hypothetical protein GCM10025868_05170 [Angustibacter aerolatus]|uniref:Transketolase C-terminal domain-containing protein n=1 Tax=Angustibacter aerolatus TaxID=1162965 RepID=A0ABQ6JBT9_9ACTN|nr:hypothetical protein GCM10025868_05170 [Angustibacter aerolatus]
MTLEDNSRVGGVGSRLAQALRDAGSTVPLVDLGIPPRFLDHGTRAEVLASLEARRPGRHPPSRRGASPGASPPSRTPPSATTGAGDPRSTRDGCVRAT